MRTIKFKHSGRIMTVENNVAFGFLDRKLAVIWTKEMEKGIEEAPMDKMISRKKDKRVKIK